MATTAAEMTETYPLPSCRFMVRFGDEHATFTRVSGLDITRDVITYRDGMSNLFQMPGLLQAVNVTLSQGIFPGQNKLFEWINSINSNAVEKKDVTISLINEAGTTVFISWLLINAFPTSLTSPSFDASSNEIAVQDINLTADRVTIQTA